MGRSEKTLQAYLGVFLSILVFHVAIYGGKAQKQSNGGSSAAHDFQSGVWEDDKGAPTIELAEQKKVVLRTGSVKVDVGTTVWAVRGTSVTVSCKATGTPNPVIRWFRDGYEIIRFEDYVGVVNGELVIRRVAKFNEGKYVCNASNSEGWQTADFNLKIFSLYQPTILKADGDFSFGPNMKNAEITIGSSVTVYRGTTLTIRCPNEATTRPIVYWTNQGKPIAIGKARQVGNDIIITDIDKIFAFLYTCNVRTHTGQTTADSKVNVLDLAEPKIKAAEKHTLDLSGRDSANVTIGTDVKVLSGTSVTITCPIQSVPKPLRSWKVKGETIDPKDERYEFTVDQSILTLLSAKTKDSAVHSCVATNNAGSDTKDTRITVLAPLLPRILHSKETKMFVRGEEGEEVLVDIGMEVTVLSGLTLNVRCRVHGRPAPHVSWNRNGTQIPLGSDKRLAVVGNTLRISNLTRGDAGRYTCSATNSAGSVSHDSSVNVIESKIPKIPASSGRVVGVQGIEDVEVFIGQDLRVVEGVIVRLRCPVTGFPRPQVRWFKNKYEVVAEGRFILEEIDRLLIIDGIRRDDTGQFACVAENIAGRVQEYTFVRILSESSANIIPGNSRVESVNSLEPVNIKIGDNLHVLSGSDVTMDCLASGTPAPFITWRRNGRPIKSGDGEGQFKINQITGGSQLITYQISQDVVGNYECIATNIGGADRRISIVSVLDARVPTIETEAENIISMSNRDPVSIRIGSRVQLLAGSPLTLSCPATGIPEPAIAWFKGNDPVEEGQRISVVGESLLIRKTEVSDSATYKCTATNVISDDYYTSIVQVIDAVKPRIMETPRNLTLLVQMNVVAIVGGTILTVASSSVELKCRAEGIPIPEISWKRGEVVVSKEKSFKIPNAQKADSDSYTCVASNIAGQDARTSRLLIRDFSKPSIQSRDDEINSSDEKPVDVVIGTKVTAIQGTKISIVCSVSGFPQPTVVWQRDNKKINKSSEARGFFIKPLEGSSSSTLVIEGKQGSGDNAVYGCSASNEAGTVASYSRVTFLDLRPPKVLSTYITGSVGRVERLDSRAPLTITVGDNAHVLTKTQISIFCPVTGLPHPKVTWTKGGKPLSEGHSHNGTHLVLSASNDVPHSVTYTCTATNRLGEDSASSSVLSVGPKPPNILSSFSSTTLLRRQHFTMHIGSNITSVLNNNISISCKAEGRPSPELSWRKDGNPLSFKGDQLDLHFVKLSDMGVYTCEATNLAGNFALRSHVVILDQEPVKNISKPKILTDNRNVDYPSVEQPIQQVIGGNLTILEGRDLVLTCTVEGEPAPSISWLFNGKQVEPSDTLIIDAAAGQLTVIEITNEEAGEYACVAKNILGQDKKVSFATVVEPVTPVIVANKTNTTRLDPSRTPLQIKVGGHVETLTGTTVTITCEAFGYPSPKITWSRRGQAITMETDQRLSLIGSALTIERPRVNESAEYVCTASNPGGDVSAATSIKFQESTKPRILTSSEDRDIMDLVSVVFRVGRGLRILGGSNVTIECETVGIPPPQITWSKDGRRLDTTGSLLELRDISISDSGLYKCSASNIAGSVEESTSVVIKEGRKPQIASSKKSVSSVEELRDVNLTIGGNLTALAGARVRLSCPADGFPKPSITWQRNENVLESADQNDGLLVISALRVDDKGSYSCSATNVFGVDSSKSYFTVLEPTDPRILATSQPKEIMNRVSLTERVGSSLLTLDQSNVTLKCEATGIPRPRISWSKDGRSLNVTSPLLKLPLIKRQDEGRYTCTATNLRGPDVRYTIISVIEGEKPRVLASKDSISSEKEISDTLVVIGGNLTALAGSRVQLSCPSVGLPKPVLTWSRNGKTLTEADGVDANNAALIISELKVDEQGSYTCTASNVLGSDSKSSYFTVLEPTKPQIQSSAENNYFLSRASVELTIGDSLTTLDGNNVTLKCKVQGIPAPRVSWRKDGAAVETSGDLFVLQHIRREDSGSYTCTAVNLLGSDSQTSRISVQVGQKPKIHISNENITSVQELPSQLSVTIGDKLQALVGSNIRLGCTATGFPGPTFSLTRNGEPLVDSDKVSLVNKSGSISARFKLSVNDHGTFSCAASNALGSDEVQSVFEVVELVPPKIYTSSREFVVVNSIDPVRIAVGEGLTFLKGGDIIVECIVLFGLPKPVVSWMKDGVEVPQEKLTENALTLMDSQMSDSGNYTCTARNAAGEMSATSRITVTETTLPTIKVSSKDITSLDKSPVKIVIGDSLLTVSGTSFTITCSADGKPIPKVTWTKGNETLPSDGRMAVNGGTLGIAEAQPSDSGLYVCTARSAGGVVTTESRVTVIETSRPQILTSDVHVQVLKRQPLTTKVGSTVRTLTGNDVTLTCAAAGSPRPNITWTSEGMSLVSKENLTIPAAEPANSGVYTCTAENVVGSDTQSTTLEIIDPVPATIRTFSRNISDLSHQAVRATIGDTVTTLDGNNVTLVCNVSGVPDPKVMWYGVDGAVVQNSGSFLTLVSVAPEGSGTYTCRAVGLDSAVNVSSKVSVYVGSKPVIAADNMNIVNLGVKHNALTIGSNMTVLASSDLEVTCPVRGFPKPAIMWYRDNTRLSSGMKMVIHEESGKLTVLSISHRKSGTYTCVASNVLGNSSASSVVEVMTATVPHINASQGHAESLENWEPAKITIGKDLTALTQTTVTIVCPVTGVPQPSITWYKNDKVLETVEERFHADGVNLIIEDITLADMGRYACKAKNLMGEATYGSNLLLIEPVPPKILSDVRTRKLLRRGAILADIGSTITTITENGLLLACNATGTPAPRIEWRKDGLLRKINELDYSIMSLSQEDSGMYTCSASNILGSVIQTSFVNVTLGTKPTIISLKRNRLAINGENDVKIVVGGNLTTISGTEVQIFCPVQAYPKPTISWRFSGSSTSYLVSKDSSYIYFQFGVSPSDSGFYTCVANNSLGSDTQSTYMSVIVSVEPKIHHSNRKIEDYDKTDHVIIVGDTLHTLVGSMVSMSCKAIGNPPPKVTWTKGGLPIDTSLRTRAIFNGTLVINEGTWSDAGRYRCQATNVAGTDEKFTFLQFKPPSKPEIQADNKVVESYTRKPVDISIGGTVKVLRNTSVTLRCNASGIPRATYVWHKSKPNASDVDIENEFPELTLREVGVEDAGEYTCVATNKAGEDSSSTSLLVLEPVAPSINSSTKLVEWYDNTPQELLIGTRVKTLTGTRVTLKCLASGFPEPKVTWTLGDNGVPAVSGQYQIINHSLIIARVQAADSGHYTCVASSVVGTVAVTTELSVMDPKPPEIISSKDTIISVETRNPITAAVGTEIHALVGTEVSLQCSSTGVPSPRVLWSKQEREELQTLQEIAVNSSRTLVIYNSTIRDSGRYQCTAISQIGVDTEETNLVFVEPVPPAIQAVSGLRVPLKNTTKTAIQVGSIADVRANTSVEITCPVSGLPLPTVTWSKDGKELISGGRYLIDKNVLTISGLVLEDSGEYSCTAVNIQGRDRISGRIQVIESMPLRILADTRTVLSLSDLEPVSVTVGGKVSTLTTTQISLRCPVEGKPKPAISWKKGGQQVTSGERLGMDASGTLTVKRARTADSGEYQCTARNAFAEVHAATIVSVIEPVHPTITSSKLYVIWYEKQPFRAKIGDNLTTIKGRKVTIVCPATGIPHPAITWYRAGQRIHADARHVISGDKLIIDNLDVLDTDRYTCVAKNIAGMVFETTTLKVYEPVPPMIFSTFNQLESLRDRKPVNVTIGSDVTLMSGTPLTIKCPVRGVPMPKFIWAKGQSVLESSDKLDMDCNGTLRIHKLQTKDSGEYTCTAENLLGMDMAFTNVVVYDSSKPQITTPDEPKDIPIGDGNPVSMTVGDNVTALPNTTISITCPTSGVPKPRVTWKKNGEVLSLDENNSVDSSGTLTVRHAKESAAYTCSVENEAGTDGATSSVVVVAPMVPKIVPADPDKNISTSDGSPVNIDVGVNITSLTNTSITIRCPNSGVPRPTVTWSMDGRNVAGAHGYEILEDGSLVIKRALTSGIYTCSVTNAAGTDSASSSVIVNEPRAPVIHISQEGQDVESFDGRPFSVSVGDSVTTLAETTIMIHCSASGFPKPDIAWRKDGQRLVKTKRLITHSNGSLTISEALLSDSGEYTCVSSNRFGEETLSSLVTIVEPQTPKIPDSKEPKTVSSYDGQPVVATIGDSIEVLPDTTVTVLCKASGVPEPQTSWLRDGLPISEEGRFTVSKDGSLTISKALASDSAMYTCVSRNKFGENQATSSITVVEEETPSISVPDDPQSFESYDGQTVSATIGDSIETLADTSITVQCAASGIPEPSITWKKDGQFISQDDRISISKNGSLSISKAVSSDSGEYSCVARNRFGENTMTSTIRVVDVDTPSISVPKDPQSVKSYDGQSVIASIGDSIETLADTSITVQCAASGVPEPSITWTKDGQFVSQDERISISKNGSLSISKAVSSDSGEYSCVARNRFGENTMTSTIRVVDVDTPSIFIPKDSQSVKSYDGQSVSATIGDSIETLAETTITVQCSASGVPEPSITWTKDGQLITQNERIDVSKNGSLIIVQALASDSGEYSCVARNRFGENRVTSTIRVVDVETPSISVPEVPQSVKSYDGESVSAYIGDSIETLTDTSITVHCAAAGFPEPSITWRKDGQLISQDERIAMSSNGSLTISKALASDTGEYSCVARNRFGENTMTSTIRVVEEETPSISVPDDPQSFESYDGQTVSATIGDSIETLADTNITVQCPASGVPEPSITWTKDGQVVTQDERIVMSSNGFLTISKASISDTGEYSCVARNRFGENTMTSTIRVVEQETPSISVPDDPQSFESYDSQTVSATIGDSIKTLADTNITVQCPASGVPEPSITWTKDGQLITQDDRISVHKNGSLSISKSLAADSGEYACVARNRFGENTMTSTIRVVDIETPAISVPKESQSVNSYDNQPVMTNIGDSVETLTDTTITVECEASGVPEPSVTWLKDGQPLTEGGRIAIFKGSLKIVNTSTSDSGKYSCVARNRFGENTMTSTISIVESQPPKISAPDQPGIIMSYDGQDVVATVSDSIQTLADTTITIQCPAIGIPQPNITWLWNGRSISGRARVDVSNNGSLTISKASSSDSGEYTCVARNRFGENKMTSSVYVTDPQAPSIFLSETPRSFKSYGGKDVIAKIRDSVETASGTNVSIMCDATGIPQPSITWLKDGQPISQDRRFTVSSRGTLTISRILVSDSGKYTCVARNKVGESKMTSAITVVGAQKPIISSAKEPQHFNLYDGQPVIATIGDTINTLTDTAVTVHCVASGDPEPSTRWLKDGRPVTQDERVRVSKNGSLAISKALVSDSAEYTCVARNTFGEDKATSSVAVIASIPARINVPRPGKHIPIGSDVEVRTSVGNNITELLFVDISLLCPSTGFPKPVVTWMKNGEVLVSGKTYTVDVNGTLTFNADSPDIAGLYTCMVENIAGKDAVSSLIDLEEPLAPLIAPSAGSATMLKDRRPVSFAVGDSVTALTESVISISCEATGVPRPNVTWTKDDHVISTGARLVIRHNGTLLIRSLELGDSGRYVCTVKSRAGQDSQASNILVKEPLGPSIMASGATIDWYELKPLQASVGVVIRTIVGPEISLSCPTSGFPPPDVTWKKEGKELESLGSLLKIGGFQKVDAGRYTCEASNIAGAASASSVIYVAERSKPVIEKSAEEITWETSAPLSVTMGGAVDIETSTTLTMICKVSGFPKPVVSWKRGNKTLMSDGRVTITSQSLSILNTQLEDSNEYTCTATNVLGSDAATTEVLVRGKGQPIVLSVPDYVVDLNTSRPVEVTIGNRLTTKANATVVVTCPTSGSPEPTITWTHNQRPVLLGEKYSIGDRGLSLTVRDVQREDEGRVVCTASNAAGNTTGSLNMQLAVAPVVKNLKGSFEVTDIRDLLSITTGAVVMAPKGITIRVKCEAMGVPAPNITWFRRHTGTSDSRPGEQTPKNGNYVRVRPTNNLRILDDRSLSISSSKVLEATEYVCVATNVAGRDEGRTVINIGVAPEITDSLGRKAHKAPVRAVATIVRGSTLSIKCSAVGTPQPNITWRVDSSRHQGFWRVLKDGTLQVPYIDEVDEGNYTCIANNSYGIVNRTTSVSVLVPPSILDRHFRQVKIKEDLDNNPVTQLEVKRKGEELAEVRRGQNVVIICAVSGKPKPKVEWQFDRRQIINDTRHVIMSNGVLLVRDVKTEESGQYKCVAENSVGKDEGSLAVRVREDEQNVTGYWYAHPWSKCGDCVSHFRGFRTRNVSCVDMRGNILDEKHCSHHSKASARQSCFSHNCQLTWRTSAWSECSSSCGTDGVQSRTASCVYLRSQASAGSKCNLANKPLGRRECNRKPCSKGECEDKVQYCDRVKRMKLCRLYQRWCCKTC